MCGTPDIDTSSIILQKKKAQRVNKINLINAELKSAVEEGSMDWGIMILKIGEYSVQILLLPTLSDLSRFVQWFEADFYPGKLISKLFNFALIQGRVSIRARLGL